MIESDFKVAMKDMVPSSHRVHDQVTLKHVPFALRSLTISKKSTTFLIFLQIQAPLPVSIRPLLTSSLEIICEKVRKIPFVSSQIIWHLSTYNFPLKG